MVVHTCIVCKMHTAYSTTFYINFEFLLILRFSIRNETLTFILRIVYLSFIESIIVLDVHSNRYINVQLNYSHIFSCNLLDFRLPSYTLTFVYFSHAFKFCSRSIGGTWLFWTRREIKTNWLLHFEFKSFAYNSQGCHLSWFLYSFFFSNSFSFSNPISNSSQFCFDAKTWIKLVKHSQVWKIHLKVLKAIDQKRILEYCKDHILGFISFFDQIFC